MGGRERMMPAWVMYSEEVEEMGGAWLISGCVMVLESVLSAAAAAE